MNFARAERAPRLQRCRGRRGLLRPFSKRGTHVEATHAMGPSAAFTAFAARAACAACAVPRCYCAPSRLRELRLRRCFASHAGPVLPGNVLKSPFGDVAEPTMSLTKYVFKGCEEWGEKPSVTCGSSGRSYDYAMMRMMIDRCARALLTALKLKPGDMIGLILPNIPEFAVLIHGAMEAGLVVTFANPLYTADEIGRQFLNADVKAIATIELLLPLALAVKKVLPNYHGTIWVGGEDNAKEGVFGLRSLLMADHEADLPEIDLNSVALIPYSSGTTGLPKGVQLTHKNLVVNLMQLHRKELQKYGESNVNHDTILAVPPFFHIYGFNGILNYCLTLGIHIVSIPRFTPEDYIKCLSEYKPKTLFVVPSLLAFLATHPMVTKEHLSSVEDITVGAAPSTQNMLEKFLMKCGKTREQIKLQQGYGMTESSPVTILTRFEYPYSKVGSVGQLIPGTHVKVVSLSNGEALGPNSSGELWIKGPQVMKGYLKNEEATRETVDKDGWLHTGDVAFYDEDHFFYIVDRTKELIKVKGNQVSPTELENIIMELPAVADTAVIGILDDLAGELPKAFVVLKQNADITEKEIYDFVAKKVTKYKHLDGGVVFIDSIPRNPGGKIMRNELKVLGGKSSKVKK